MRKFILIFLILFFLHLCHEISCGQSEVEDFTPGARAFSMGGSLVVQARDPSAIFWNPALLSGLKDREFLFNLNNRFSFNLLSLSQFVPLFGTFGFAIARIPSSRESVDRGTLAWGRKFASFFSFGTSLKVLKHKDDWFSDFSVGFLLGNTSDGTLDRNLTFQNASFFDYVSLGFTFRNLPLTDVFFTPSALFGLSVILPRTPLLINSGYHIQDGDDTKHLGLDLELSKNFSFTTGVENLDFDRWGMGLRYRQEYFMVDATYSKQLERFLLTITTRISGNPSQIARPYFNRANRYLKEKRFRSALSEFKKYLSFEIPGKETQQAQLFALAIERRFERTQVVIDSLFAEAQKRIYQKNPQKLNAAYDLIKILELDPTHLRARTLLNTLQPAINDFVKKSSLVGVQKFKEAQYLEARKIFEKILIFDPNNQQAHNYLQAIEDKLKELSEQYFFRGVGFYQQTKFTQAKQQFEKALEFNPNMKEAEIYLNRTKNKIAQFSTRVDSLLHAGERMEDRKDFVQAYQVYQKALQLDPDNSQVNQHIQSLKPQLESFIQKKFRQGMRLFREERLNEAIAVFNEILKIFPDYQKAQIQLANIRSQRNKKVHEYFQLAEQFYKKNDLLNALEFYKRALRLNARFEPARRKKAQVEKKLKLSKLLQEGQEKFNRGQYVEAVEKFQQVLELDSENEVARRQLELCNKKIQELVDRYFNEGIKLYSSEKYEEAIKMWDQALRLKPDFTQAKEYKKKALERIRALEALKRN